MLPTEKTRGAAAAAIQPSAPGSQQLFPDKEREVQGPAPARTRGRPSLRGVGRGRRPLPVSSSHRSGRAGGDSERSAPTSLLLPQPGSRPLPKAASPVTTTTNQQPPARTHCAGARALARRTLGFRHVRLSSSPRRVGTGLCSPRKS